MEAKLLHHLISNEGRNVSRKTLLEEVWGVREDTDTRAIDNFIVRLRRSIEPEPSKPRHLVTVRGVGYRFVAEPGPGLSRRLSGAAARRVSPSVIPTAQREALEPHLLDAGVVPRPSFRWPSTQVNTRPLPNSFTHASAKSRSSLRTPLLGEIHARGIHAEQYPDLVAGVPVHLIDLVSEHKGPWEVPG